MTVVALLVWGLATALVCVVGVLCFVRFLSWAVYQIWGQNF